MQKSFRIFEILFSVLAYIVSLSFAQSVGTETESIYIQSVFSSQKPCAQSCFAYNFAGCSTDALGGALGCNAPLCSPKWAATNDCYCRTDLQSVATSYLSSCVDRGCTVGDFSIDVSSAISIYDSYCGGNGYGAMGNSPAATTAVAGGANHGATPASTAKTPGATETSSSNANNNNNNVNGGTVNVSVGKGGASSSTTSPSKIAIGVAVPLLVLAAAAFWWFLRWKKRTRGLQKTAFGGESTGAIRMNEANEFQSRSVAGEWGDKPQMEFGADAGPRYEVGSGAGHGWGAAAEVSGSERVKVHEIG